MQVYHQHHGLQSIGWTARHCVTEHISKEWRNICGQTNHKKLQTDVTEHAIQMISPE